MSRIEHAPARLRARRDPAAASNEPGGAMPDPGTPTDLPGDPQPAVQDLGGAGFAADLVDLIDDIRQVWRQGLEVLADPQGWRS